MMFIFFTLLKTLIIIILILIAVAYFTLAERKILGAIQRRRGPNVVGFLGLLQPLSDGLKLFLKETIIPSTSNKFLFTLSPILTFMISLFSWAVIPFGANSILSDIHLSTLFCLAASSLGVYGIILSGWSSNSKYAFLGALRSTAQMVSYEVSFSFIIIILILCTGSFNLYDIVLTQNKIWFIIPLFPLALLFFISALAETNRHPFDLPEAEAELVSGYNVEYSAMGFALFSLGEYSSMLIMCALTIIFFFGGWFPPVTNVSLITTLPWFALKMILMVLLYVFIRAALPRYRYDQLMNIGWKVFLPITLVYMLFIFSLILTFNLQSF